MAETTKRLRDDSDLPESETDSPEVKRLRENLLDGLDDDPDLCCSNPDLDSFMKRFEEEINAGGGAAADSGESRPELGYLLEASDDELGIPPPAVGFGNELARLESDPNLFGGEFWGIPDYDDFGSGSGVTDNLSGGSVAVDGLFESSDLVNGSGEYPWRPETLPAL